MSEIKVIGIVVLYCPEDYKIVSNLISLAKQFNLLYIIDNTPNTDLSKKFNKIPHIKYNSLDKNIGIAAAQNIGIEYALSNQFTHIIFLDQDSNVPSYYVRRMIDEYQRILKYLPNLFLLGPTTINGRNGTEYKSTIHKFSTTKFGFIPQREIISSGSCVSVDKIRKIGILDQSLFIDYVDFDWCWRGNSKGFKSGITPGVKLTHFVGIQEYNFINQLIIISSPKRYYYQTRNYIWLLRTKHVPFQWKIDNGIKKILFPLTYPFKVKFWTEIYKNIMIGFLAGIKRKTYE